MVNQLEQHGNCRVEIVGTWAFTVQYFNLSTGLQLFIKNIEKKRKYRHDENSKGTTSKESSSASS